MILVLDVSETGRVLDYQTATEAICAGPGEVVLREKPRRTGNEEITVFEAVGLATERMKVAERVEDPPQAELD